MIQHRHRFDLACRAAALLAIVLGFCGWSATTSAQAPTADALRTSGEPLRQARLESLTLNREADGDPQAFAIFQPERGQPTRVAFDSLVRWGYAADYRNPVVLLADGGVLPVVETIQPIRIDDETLKFDSVLFGELTLPLDRLRGVALKLPRDPTASIRAVAQLRRTSATAGQPATDLLVLTNGDELTGTIVAWQDGKITIAAAGRRSEIELAQVAGVSFNPALAREQDDSQPNVIVGFADGSRLAATRLETLDGARLRVTSLGDMSFSARLGKLVFIQPQRFATRYLSDLPAASYKHVPFLDLRWDYRRDASVRGGPLAASGNRYLKGLGMHSPSRITYRLDGKYQRFQAEAAIDDATQAGGSVVCRVYVDDGSGRWQPRFTSDVIRGGATPVPIDIDVKDVKQISLLVEYADRGDQLDHLNWLDARLIP